jgi:hypothetical protein
LHCRNAILDHAPFLELSIIEVIDDFSVTFIPTYQIPPPYAKAAAMRHQTFFETLQCAFARLYTQTQC